MLLEAYTILETYLDFEMRLTVERYEFLATIYAAVHNIAVR